MNLHDFLKPTIEKIILFLVLFIFVQGLLMGRSAIPGTDLPGGGWPFVYQSFDCSQSDPTDPYCLPGRQVEFPGLFLDIVFWYLMAAILIHVFKKGI